MIEIKKGRFFYKLVTEKKAGYRDELIRFLSDKGVHERETEKVKGIDFSQAVDTGLNIEHNVFELNIKIVEDEVILLFGCQLDSNEFHDMIAGYFQ